MRTRFDEQMEELHVELIKMGSLCEEAIALSVQVLLECSKEQNEEDEEVMQETIADLRGKVSNLEEEIDSKEYEIETLCMRLLLQQQPVARDLRNISSALKMISDMERIGDQAADIADLTSKGLGHYSQSMIHIDDMAKAGSHSPVRCSTPSSDLRPRARPAGRPPLLTCGRFSDKIGRTENSAFKIRIHERYENGNFFHR